MTRSSSKSAVSAAVWAVRVESGEMTEETWAEFARWMDADLEHPAAFNAAQTALGMAEVALARPRPLATPTRLSTWRARTAIGGAVAVIAASLALAFLSTAPKARLLDARYETTGSILSVRLADASTITLNRRSEIEVHYTNSARRVVLAPGSEAAFDVTKDPTRPFEIRAGAQTVRVVGTAFDVKDDPESFTVAVSRGLVHVSSHLGGPGFDLSLGNRLVLSKVSRVWSAAAIAPKDVASWRQGRLVYNAAPLSEVAADIARAGADVVVTPQARSIKFTGVLKFSDSRSMAKTLTLFLPIEAKIDRDQIVMGVRRH